MLRKRLLLVLASLTMLMLCTAVSAVLLMNGVLNKLEHINSVAMAGASTSGKMGSAIASIETELSKIQRSSIAESFVLLKSVESLGRQIDELDEFYMEEPENINVYQQLNRSMVALEFSIAEVVESTSASSDRRIEIAMLAINRLRKNVIEHSDFAIRHMNHEQADVTSRFRLVAIGLAIVFVLIINISMVVLLRTASSILKPVDRLIEASRHLAKENFSYRVDVDRHDEFDELAKGFNTLAQHLENNEQRKIETLHQVARTLNHELNNAIAIIELQLQIVTKSPGYDRNSGDQLRLIHETLERMNGTVVDLTKVRRVVLTEYTKGVQMLDLKLSTQPILSTDNQDNTNNESDKS